MVKSIRLLLLIAVIQISFSSCLLWKESFLSLKQTNAYFLILIVGISVLCAGINYFHTADQSRHSVLHVQKKSESGLLPPFSSQSSGNLSSSLRKHPDH